MAVQTTPHTNTQQNVDSAAMDIDAGISRQDLGQGDDAALYENNEGAQTGGPRAFHRNDNRDGSPISEGDPGITNAGTSEERKQQEKVVGK